MIFDKISNLEKYKSIPNINQIVDFIRNSNFLDLPEGKTEINGKKLFANSVRYLPKPPEENNFEIHKLYTDVHLVLKGAEKIQITNKENLKKMVEDKISQDDFQLFTAFDYISDIIAGENDFIVFFPGEPHKPGCSFRESDEEVSKIIFKTTY